MRLKFSIKSKVETEKAIEGLKMVLFKSMVKMHELATINCPVDTGRLRTSIILKPTSPGYNDYVLSDGVDYGIDVEFGTSPHYLSPANLKGWSRRVLGKESLAFAVANKIAKKGTEAQPFFRPALDQVKNIWVKRYSDQEFRKGSIK
jgi:hypothetical protein